MRVNVGIDDQKLSRTLLVVATLAICTISSMLSAAATLVPQDAKNASASVPRFDVVSVKPCEPTATGQRRGGGGTPITSTGRLSLPCYTLFSLFQEAYISFADGRGHGLAAARDVDVEGVPDWMRSERYAIEAKTEQVAPAAVMRGPMLQAVLEDRFKLKVRRVTREMPVYELVAVQSGAKVSPYTGNDCVIRDEAIWPPITLPDGQRYCGDRTRTEGCAESSDASALMRSCRIIREGVATLNEFASLLSFDRPVVNRTGITAPVSYRFEYVWEDHTGNEAPQASWLSKLRSQLGLDVRAWKGPREYLVIDHVERPTPNGPAAIAGKGDR